MQEQGEARSEMTIINLDDICGDCPHVMMDRCGGCLRTAMHDLVNAEYAPPDLYEEPQGPRMVGEDHKWVNDE